MFILSQDKKIIINSDTVIGFSIEDRLSRYSIDAIYLASERDGCTLGFFENEEKARYVFNYLYIELIKGKCNDFVIPTDELVNEMLEEDKNNENNN